jgi:ABC-type Fe3+ transport system permease subunit
MQPLPLEYLVPLGALDAVGDLLPFAILVVALVDLLTRFLAQRSYARQAEADEDDDSVSRYLPHEAMNWLLLLLSFAYLIVEPHGGMVLAVLVVGVFVSDFFEFEARNVEVRNEMELEAPKSAIFASLLVVLYAAFQAVFFVIQPYWSQIV